MLQSAGISFFTKRVAHGVELGREQALVAGIAAAADRLERRDRLGAGRWRAPSVAACSPSRCAEQLWCTATTGSFRVMVSCGSTSAQQELGAVGDRDAPAWSLQVLGAGRGVGEHAGSRPAHQRCRAQLRPPTRCRLLRESPCDWNGWPQHWPSRLLGHDHVEAGALEQREHRRRASAAGRSARLSARRTCASGRPGNRPRGRRGARDGDREAGVLGIVARPARRRASARPVPAAARG